MPRAECRGLDRSPVEWRGCRCWVERVRRGRLGVVVSLWHRGVDVVGLIVRVCISLVHAVVLLRVLRLRITKRIRLGISLHGCPLRRGFGVAHKRHRGGRGGIPAVRTADLELTALPSVAIEDIGPFPDLWPRWIVYISSASTPTHSEDTPAYMSAPYEYDEA